MKNMSFIAYVLIFLGLGSFEQPCVAAAPAPETSQWLAKALLAKKFFTDSVPHFVTTTALPAVKDAFDRVKGAEATPLNTVAGIASLAAVDTYLINIIPGSEYWSAFLGLGLPALAYVGIKKLNNLEGVRNVISDLNTIATEGQHVSVPRENADGEIVRDAEGNALMQTVHVRGFSAVVRAAAGQAGGAIAERTRKELVSPALDKMKEQLKPTGESINSLVTHAKKFTFSGILKTVAAATLMFYGGRLAYNYLTKQMNKPRLDVIVKKAPSNMMEEQNRLRPMVFNDSVKKQIQNVLESTFAISTSNKDSRASYKNILLYGPSGSGKRMFAEQIAARCRLDFYEIPKSSFMKLNEHDLCLAIEQFFKSDLLKSPEGAVVYIDNAHLFFSNRSSLEAVTSAHRANLISCLIEQAEKKSSNCMIVFGMDEIPNLKGDTALIIDQVIEIGLPKKPERIKLLNLYLNLYFGAGQADSVLKEDVQAIFSTRFIEQIADKLDNVSAAELEGFMKTIKIESDLPGKGLSTDLVTVILERNRSVRRNTTFGN